MGPKNGFAASESDRRLIRENSYYIREALFSCTTETQVECAVAFARYLCRAGINSENYWLFLRLVITNNPWVIDELLHDRVPRLLFSTIKPEAELIDVAFQSLYARHPEEIYPPALEALLGIIESAYFDPDDGYRIRKLAITDINALGKFLLKGEPQEQPLNSLILDILDHISRLGGYFGEPDKSVLSKQAFNVRYAYFDTTRDLIDAIPHPLLVRLPDTGVSSPEEDFVDLVAKRRERRRDASGRFVKSSSGEAQAAPGPSPAEPPSPENESSKPDPAQKPERSTTVKANAARKDAKRPAPAAPKGGGPRRAAAKGSKAGADEPKARRGGGSGAKRSRGKP
jgi:hypothetical protein